MPLTALKIKQTKPRADGKPARFADSGGLYLEVSPNGGRYWRWKYRVDGKEKRLALGVYPEIGLAEAREKRDEARKTLRDGGDPSAQRQEAKRAKRIMAANSFEAVAREWCASQANRWTNDHGARVLTSLEIDVFPAFGRVPVALLDAPTILDAVRKIEARGASETAGRVLQRIGSVMRYAIQTGRATANPTLDLRGALKAQKVEHRPALDRKDLPAFLKRLADEPLREETRIAMRLLILTFLRPGELRHGRWDEIDWERKEWRIPGPRMKMRAPHIVPLSAQAFALLNALHELTGRGDLMFPAVAGGDKVGHWSAGILRVRAA